MDKQKVLIFIDWFSPGYKAGGPTTSNVNIVEHLKDIFDFYVITSDTDYNEKTPYSGITPDTWIKKCEGLSVYYFSKGRLSLNSLKRVAKDAGCNVWYINGIYSKYFSIFPLLLASQIKPKRIIVSARGMLSPHALSIKTIPKKIYLRTANLLGLFRHVIFHATNNEEANYIKQAIGNNAQTISIENLPRKASAEFFATSKNNDKIKLASFARISPEKNTLYAIQCLKSCKAEVEYDIYGQINSQSYWEECKKLSAELPKNVTVKYKGAVSPAEMPKIYQNYHFMYLPTTGENFGHAILESLLNSTPVIISDKTPWKNLKEKNVGWDLPLDNTINFSDTIDSCASLTSSEYENMAYTAYEYAQGKCRNPQIKQEYITLFRV